MKKLPAIIAGPCAMESLGLMKEVAAEALQVCTELGFDYIFKSSFQKANRSQKDSFQGPGLETGVKYLESIKSEFGCKVTTDVHEVWQIQPLTEVLDVFQIPALLSRQTPLISSAAATGKAINIKRGQFMAPWKIDGPIGKAKEAGASEIIITERGSMNGYEDLVVDFRTLVLARERGVSAGFDGTHSTQTPASKSDRSGGRPEFIDPYVRAATAIGVDYIFLETHPEPADAKSDGDCMLPLSQLKNTLVQIKALSMASY